LFQFYITDSHDWIALMVFEATALVVSSLSNQVSRHARELERRQVQQERLYELSQQILLLDRSAEVDQQLVDLMRSSLRAKGVALWNAYEMHQYKSGDCDFLDVEVRSTYFLEINEDDVSTGVSRRVLRLGTRPTGSLCLDQFSLFAGRSCDRAGTFLLHGSERGSGQAE
jgi:two-component system, OmpR family, sensor histidine kinase KdpD